MLTYNDSFPKKFLGDAVDNVTRVYEPPINEFYLTKSQLDASTDSYTLVGIKGTSLMLCYDGDGTISAAADDSVTIPLKAGSVVAIPDLKDVVLKSSRGQSLTVFRCSTNPKC